MKADMILDCIGLYCPMPIIKTAKKIKSLAIGDTLEILSDDEGIRKDIPAWCKQTGNTFLDLEEEGGKFRVFIRVGLTS